LEDGQEIRVDELGRSESDSLHVVQIRTKEEPHAYDRNDLVAILKRGEGTLFLGSRKMRLVPGSIVYIPKGITHSFINKSPRPAVALVVFSPPLGAAEPEPPTPVPSAGNIQGGPILDLTQELVEGIPLFPGGVPFRKEAVARFEKEGYLAYRLELGEHTGTHLDAPAHFWAGGQAAHEISPEQMIGPGICVSIVKKVEKDPDAVLDVKDLMEWEKSNGSIPAGAHLLIQTGWSSRWPDEKAYRNSDPKGKMHFPGISPQGARLLVDRRAVAVGIDTLSIDPGASTQFEAHRILSRANIVILENLNNLDRLPAKGFTLVAAPLKIRGGSGGPARVLAIFSREEEQR